LQGEAVHHLISTTHPDWHQILKTALNCVDSAYLAQLTTSCNWLPGSQKLFAAFSEPLSDLRYILLGESPYPRQQSANGYAFWDGAVHNIWSAKGLSKEVNRATSLRNFIKMLLVARGDLVSDTSQDSIAALDKTQFWQTADELFQALLDKNFLLLNASLVYEENNIRFHAKNWQPFVTSILTQLLTRDKPVQLLLFGRIAAEIPEASLFTCLIAPHPYNLSFITNPDVLAFFKPLNILSRYDE
jgi:uracil-DNA glycosylase